MTLRLIEQPPRAWKLFFDDEYVKTVSYSIVRRNEILALSPADLQECQSLLHSLEYKGAVRFAMAALARQSLHSEKLNSRLRRHFLSPKLVDEVLEFCRTKGWIDDDAWIERRVQTWHAAGRSNREIAARLSKDRLSSPPADDREALKILLQKRQFPKNTKKERDSTIRKLIRRGFSFELIKEFIIN